jgi:hypothetical protein
VLDFSYRSQVKRGDFITITLIGNDCRQTQLFKQPLLQ